MRCALELWREVMSLRNGGVGYVAEESSQTMRESTQSWYRERGSEQRGCATLALAL